VSHQTYMFSSFHHNKKMDISFTEPTTEPISERLSLKERLQKATIESKVSKDVAWGKLKKKLEDVAKRGRFYTIINIEDLGPLSIDDFEKLKFHASTDTTNHAITVSWCLDDDKHFPQECNAKTLYGTAFNFICRILEKHAVRTGSSTMVVSRYTSLTDLDLEHWKQILRREGLHVVHRNGDLIVQW